MKVRVLFVLAIGLLVALATTATAQDTQLPEENFTKSADSGKEYTFGWRTALGALEMSSQESYFNYSIKETSFGPFTDCVGGKCPVNQSGWMYWVNYPQESMPGVAAGQYQLEQGDVVTWYFSESMSDTPANSSYRINVTIGDGFSVDINITDPDGVNNTLEKAVSKHSGFEWINEKPTKNNVVNSVSNAVTKYFNTEDETKRTEVVRDVTQMVGLYFNL